MRRALCVEGTAGVWASLWDAQDALADGWGDILAQSRFPFVGKGGLIEQDGGAGSCTWRYNKTNKGMSSRYSMTIPNEEKNSPASRHAKNTGLL